MILFEELDGPGLTRTGQRRLGAATPATPGSEIFLP